MTSLRKWSTGTYCDNHNKRTNLFLLHGVSRSVGRSSERILYSLWRSTYWVLEHSVRETNWSLFSLTIYLLGRETPCKRNKSVLSLTVTAPLSVHHWGLSTVCSEDFHLPVDTHCNRMRIKSIKCTDIQPALFFFCCDCCQFKIHEGVNIWTYSSQQSVHKSHACFSYRVFQICYLSGFDAAMKDHSDGHKKCSQKPCLQQLRLSDMPPPWVQMLQWKMVLIPHQDCRSTIFPWKR